MLIGNVLDSSVISTIPGGDVEVTLTADFFTQMRSTMNAQRALVNQMILDSDPTNPWLSQPAGVPDPRTTREVLRYATLNGGETPPARPQDRLAHAGQGGRHHHSRCDRAQRGAAQQVPGAVVSLMDRTNVETVIVAGKVRKWQGRLLDVDLRHLRRQLEASRDYIFATAGIEQDLFRDN
jgi:5-methylthioadenosine/S-adenosylhomocysteine deaminase